MSAVRRSRKLCSLTARLFHRELSNEPPNRSFDRLADDWGGSWTRSDCLRGLQHLELEIRIRGCSEMGGSQRITGRLRQAAIPWPALALAIEQAFSVFSCYPARCRWCQPQGVDAS